MKYQLFILFICLNLASCAITGKKHHYTGTKHNNKGAIRIVGSAVTPVENSGIIYGNIQSNSQLKNVEIYKLLANGKVDPNNHFRVRTFSNGNFIVENLLPGNYIISSVETKNNFLGLYATEREMEFYSIQVRQAEAVYAGTYKIIITQHNDNINVMRSAYPNEKKILQHVSQVERDSIWYQSLKARMRILI
ncbi:MAG: hypothetical protein ACC653_03080 [Gammaproteobacteria bacterium]